jgi:hypothetical protein
VGVVEGCDTPDRVSPTSEYEATARRGEGMGNAPDPLSAHDGDPGAIEREAERFFDLWQLLPEERFWAKFQSKQPCPELRGALFRRYAPLRRRCAKSVVSVQDAERVAS